MSSKNPMRSDEGVSATSTSGLEYEVFLNFRGPDTRAGFTDYLYVTFTNAGIRVFRDDEELRKGENIRSNLLKAINQSKIAIPIFSKGYAASKWCLKELVQIMECKKANGLKVMPVFYDVTPSEVKNQTGDFGKVCELHEKYYDENIKDWRKALREVGELKGWDVQNDTRYGRQEGQLVKEMTNTVLRELKKSYLVVTNYLVGLEHHVEEVLNTLNVESDGVKIIALHGMGGIGKTTLAKVVYNHLLPHFENHCFLANIRESARSKGIEFQQNKLISDVMNMEWTSISNIDEGIAIISERFYNKKVLLVLDDVDEPFQLQALMGKRECFHFGSKIIITTRNRSITDQVKVDRSFALTGLDSHQALQLFSQHAFRSDKPPEEYTDLSLRMIKIAAGLPLSLEVFGSLLCGKSKKEWVPILKKLEKVPHKEVSAKLKISYDALDDQQKQIFLDIACFFIGQDMKIAIYFWDEWEFAEEAIEVLQQMFLIKIEKYSNTIWMHDQLRDLGRDIVRQEHMEPENRSRLWDEEEARKLLVRKMGSYNVRGIKLCYKKGEKYDTSSEDFARLPNLKFLDFRGNDYYLKKKWHERMKPNNFLRKSSIVFSKLRWLSWDNFPHNLNMSRFSFEDLVMLNLSGSRMTSSCSGWKCIKMAKNLKVLNLSMCDKLVRTPDFSYHPKLERLDLSWCKNLVEIDESMGRLEHLFIINLRCCKRLRKLPKELRCTESLEELYLDLTAIVEIPNWPPMKRLRVLDCGGCRDLKKVSSLSLPANLTGLSFSDTKITELPDSIGNLVNLRKLSLASCKGLKTLPECIGDLVSLTELDLLDSGIVVLPNAKLPQSLISLKLMCQETQIPDLSSLINLKILELRTPYGGDCPFAAHDPALPWIGKLTNLENLTLGLQYTVSLHADVGALPQLKTLSLVDNYQPQSIPKLPSSLKYFNIEVCNSLGSLKDLPSGLATLTIRRYNSLTLSHLPSSCTTLEICECEALTSFEIGSCQSLKDLEIWDCEALTSFEIGSCKSLTHLEIWDCEALTSFEIGSCKSLTDLDIWACKALTSFEVGSCKSLKVLDISECGLSKIDGLEMLENLTTLRIGSCVKLERLPDLSNLKMLKLLEVRDCPNLIEIPGWLESLDECIFNDCKSLERIPDIPNAEAMGAYFRISGCKKLKKVV